MSILDDARQCYVDRQLRKDFPPGNYVVKDSFTYWESQEKYTCCAIMEDSYDEFYHAISAEHVACKYGVGIAEVREADAAVEMIRLMSENDHTKTGIIW